MSRRRQRIPSSSDSDGDEHRIAPPASSRDADLNVLPSPLDRRSRPRVSTDARDPLRSRFDALVSIFPGLMGLVARIGRPDVHGGGAMPPELMELMRPGITFADKQQLIDATTIVCAHSGADEAQCGICLQSLEQGAPLRMAQYVERCLIKEVNTVFCNTLRMCCHKFHDDCLTEWFKVLSSQHSSSRPPIFLTLPPKDASRLPPVPRQAV